jgi:hypothetical protein
MSPVTSPGFAPPIRWLPAGWLSSLGASPAEVAAMVVDGIRSGRFYILTSDNRHGSVLRRGEEIVAGGPPTAPVDFA